MIKIFLCIKNSKIYKRKSRNYFRSFYYFNNNKEAINSLAYFRSYSKNIADNIMKDKDFQINSLLYNIKDVIKVNMVDES